MTTLSVWQIDSAHCSANCVSCGVAFRDAKNATSGLSKSSVFPDKSIKKRRRCINLSLIKALAAHYKNKQHKRPRRKYIAYTEPVGSRIYDLAWTSCCRSPCSSKPPSFDKEESSKKYPIKYVRLNGKSHKPLQRYRKFLRKREFVRKLLCWNLLSLHYIARFWVQPQWAITVWFASGEKKFRLFLFFFVDMTRYYIR